MTQAQSLTTEDAIAAYKRKAGREASKRWQAKNMDHVKAYRKAYYQAHRQEMIDHMREYRRTHPEYSQRDQERRRQKKAEMAEAAQGQKERSEIHEGLHGGGAGRDGGV